MEPDYKKIGKRIARRRKELGLRQAEVCERVGNQRQILVLYRTGDIHPIVGSNHEIGNRFRYNTG